jgi:hypothetical protein
MHMAWLKVTGKVLLVGVVLAGGFFMIRFMWLLELPESDMAPLTEIARTNASQLAGAGIVFPDKDGVEVWLSQEQIQHLAAIMFPDGKLPRLKNKWGHPYRVRVLRKPDARAPSGYYYHWAFYSVGRDGVLFTADDASQDSGNRP